MHDPTDSNSIHAQALGVSGLWAVCTFVGVVAVWTLIWPEYFPLDTTHHFPLLYYITRASHALVYDMALNLVELLITLGVGAGLGVVCGVAHWIFLRSKVGLAARWLFATSLVWMVSGMAGGAVGAGTFILVGRVIGQAAILYIGGSDSAAVIALIGSLLSGLITSFLAVDLATEFMLRLFITPTARSKVNALQVSVD